ncbi:hypothetical protein [Methylobacterium oxalidis]|uniref:Uncharacterized protein n=1 Tax=Methylobacterium oxalidis TaxID=944322 RepID=A0A512J7Z4_9HYPH|nr:hypothetical protein [Methylobacterium oxalidis]GEP06087.1 hypothetical protein MOX02_41250 [Methylobacterium oxalidis]GJE30817.1 hypothetical protein LDDCCGHA_0987 [Methylobacterium oxalidis]GLS67502.1 hypothetical protein GCM10007888_58860 [Methylobacterium oxalidis]
MTIRTTILAAAALLPALFATTTADAEGLKPARGGSIDLGTLAGVAYYTAEPEGYRVVVTLAPRAAAPSVRFEAVLAEGQRVTLSAPRGTGQAAEAVEITRRGETVTVAPARGAQAAVQEAAALN